MGSMEFDNPFAPRGLVEAIHILGYHRAEKSHLLQQCQSSVSRIGVRLDDKLHHLLQHAPDLFRLSPEGINMGIFLRIVFAPEPLVTPEIGNPTFHRDTSPRKDNGLFCREDVLNRPVDSPFLHTLSSH